MLSNTRRPWQAWSPGASVGLQLVRSVRLRHLSPFSGGGRHAAIAKPLGEAHVSCPIRGSGFVVKLESTAHPMSSSRKDSLVPWGSSRRKIMAGLGGGGLLSD